jgi:glycine/D-amino acid oxidase-like deaminating enzyme
MTCCRVQGVKGVAARSPLGAVPMCGPLPLRKQTSGQVGLSQMMSQVTCPRCRSDLELEDKVWVFAGLGSRGLIHHSILGHALAKAMLEDEPDEIPEPARCSLVSPLQDPR